MFAVFLGTQINCIIIQNMNPHNSFKGRGFYEKLCGDWSFYIFKPSITLSILQGREACVAFEIATEERGVGKVE